MTDALPSFRPDHVHLFFLYLIKFDANFVGEKRNILLQENPNLIEWHFVCRDVVFDAIVNELSIEVTVNLRPIWVNISKLHDCLNYKRKTIDGPVILNDYARW